MEIRVKDLYYVIDPYLRITIRYINPILNKYEEKIFNNIEALIKQYPRLKVITILPTYNDVGISYLLETKYPTYEIPDITKLYLIDTYPNTYTLNISQRTLNYLKLTEKITEITKHNYGKPVEHYCQMNV